MERIVFESRSRKQRTGPAPLVALAFALGCASPPPAPKPAVESKPEVSKRKIVVAANRAVTPAGKFTKGTTVRLRGVSGTWSAGPGRPSVSCEGEAGALCYGVEGGHCLGGDGQHPTMALIALVTWCPVEQPGCPVVGRDAVGTAEVTIEFPKDGFLYLGPNDWVEALTDNVGAVEVEVAP